MNRLILTTLFLVSSFDTQTLAQTSVSGTIYYWIAPSTGSPTAYSVQGNGTGFTSLPLALPDNFGQPVLPSAQTIYPGGRQFLTRAHEGLIPGVSNEAYGNLWIKDQTNGNQVQVTAFPGTDEQEFIRYPNNYAAWSNDDQDSFISFGTWNPATGIFRIYKAHVTGQQIAAVNYLPLGPNDERLELVFEHENPNQIFTYLWSGDGKRLIYYFQSSQVGATDQRVFSKVVGTPPAEPGSPIYVQTPTGMAISGWNHSPVGNLIVGVGTQTASGGTTTRGIVLMDSVTGDWSWLQREFQATKSSLTQCGSPRFSPDGNYVAFPANVGPKSRSKKAIVKCPTLGGDVVPLTYAPDGGLYRFLLRWCW